MLSNADAVEQQPHTLFGARISPSLVGEIFFAPPPLGSKSQTWREQQVFSVELTGKDATTTQDGPSPGSTSVKDTVI